MLACECLNILVKVSETVTSSRKFVAFPTLSDAVCFEACQFFKMVSFVSILRLFVQLQKKFNNNNAKKSSNILSVLSSFSTQCIFQTGFGTTDRSRFNSTRSSGSSANGGELAN